MANTSSEQEVERYTIDIAKLNAEVKRLQTENARLRDAQKKVNLEFKNGKITAEQYKTQIKQASTELKNNQAAAKQLASSLSSLGGPISKLANTISNLFMGPAGIVMAVTATLKGIYDYMEEANAKENQRIEELMENNRKKIEADRDLRRELLSYERETMTASGKTIIQAYEKQISEYDEQIKSLKSESDAIQRTISEYLISGDRSSEEYKEALAASKELLSKEVQLEQDKSYLVGQLDEARKKQRIKDIAEEYEAEMQAIKDREKYIKDQADLETTLRRKIEDLNILAIEDEKEQKIAKIKLEEKRQLESYDVIYATATEKNKQMVDEVRKLIKETTALQIKAIEKGAAVSAAEIEKQAAKIKDFINKYTSDFMRVDPQIGTEIKKLNKQLSEEAYLIETLKNKDAELNAAREKDLETAKRKYDTTISKINELESNAATSEADVAKLAKLKAEALAEYENNRVVIDKTTNQKIEQNHLETAQKIKQIESQTAQATLSTWAGCLGGIGDIFSALADTEEENSEKSLRLQEASIFMAMAAALAQGIANSVQAGWPAMLATIPATVAALLANFVQIKNLKAQANYATGGTIVGPGSGTSDSIQANVSNGEAVMTQKAVSMYAPLLSAINQSVGGAPIWSADNNNNFAVMLARAMQAQPAPIVSVESIDRAQSVIKQVNILSKL